MSTAPITRQTLLPLGLALSLAGAAFAYGKFQGGERAENTIIRVQVDALEKRVDVLQARQDKADERMDSAIQQVRSDLGQIKERLGIVEATGTKK
jgi:hypothetical protein